ncbi:dihydropteroate synthase, partial [Chromobacterium piscinae]
LLVDPGFGFGKTLEHNLALLKRLDEMERIAGAPLLVGLSRKSMLGAITGEREPNLRLGASVAAALEAARRGAAVIRVHDIKATRQALQLWQALRES